MQQTTLLSGIVGSTAYGLAHPGSDVDRLAVFAYDMSAFHGLNMPQESIVTTEPDITRHEIGKFCRLALRCNPTILELLWLNAYEEFHPIGVELINLRSVFLSAPYVRSAYLGYATQQFHRLEQRGNGTFSSDTAHRTAKHARHLARLLLQGYELYTEANLRIKLNRREVEQLTDFGEKVAAGDVELARSTLERYEEKFDNAETVLPRTAAVDTVNDWLITAREQLRIEKGA